MGRILFLSAVAYLAYRYITRSNQKVREIEGKKGTVEILPPEQPGVRGAAAEALPGPKPVARLSAAAEADVAPR